MASDPHYLLELRTIQSHAFRILVEALKDILTDCLWTFTESGAKVLAMDPSHQVLCHLRLDASRFEFYHCPRRLRLGINMMHFHKLIKTMTNNDTLCLFVDERDVNMLGVRIENSEKNTVTTYKLHLMDLHEEDCDLPASQFNSVVTMHSTEFQKYIRDMYNIADMIEIRSIGQQLILSCKGDFASQQTVIGDVRSIESTEGAIEVADTAPSDEIVQGVFSLKYLAMFTKCTQLSQQVEIYMKNDFPLICRYTVANLGSVSLALVPQASLD